MFGSNPGCGGIPAATVHVVPFHSQAWAVSLTPPSSRHAVAACGGEVPLASELPPLLEPDPELLPVSVPPSVPAAVEPPHAGTRARRGRRAARGSRARVEGSLASAFPGEHCGAEHPAPPRPIVGCLSSSRSRSVHRREPAPQGMRAVNPSENVCSHSVSLEPHRSHCGVYERESAARRESQYESAGPPRIWS